MKERILLATISMLLGTGTLAQSVKEFSMDYLPIGVAPPCNVFKDEPYNFWDAWKVSHGTPSCAKLFNDNNYQLLELKANWTGSGPEKSEGLFIDYNFQITHAYSFEIYVKQGVGHTVGLEVYAANGVTEASNTTCVEDAIPAVTTKRAILIKQFVPTFPAGNINSTSVSNWRPKANYNQLWLHSRQFDFSQSGALNIESITIFDHGEIADSQPPTVPGNFTVSNLTTSGFKITWTASTDNLDLIGYRIYRNGDLVTTTQGLTYTFSNLATCSSHNIQVVAFDSQENQSSPAEAYVITKTNLPATVTLNTDLSSQTSLSYTVTDRITLTNGFRYASTPQTPGLSLKSAPANCGAITYSNPGGRQSVSSDEIPSTESSEWQQGVDETNNESILAPNPVKNVFTISVNEDIDYRLYIYNLNGEEIKNFPRMTGTQQFDISDLDTGLYLVKVVMNGKVELFRISKQ